MRLSYYHFLVIKWKYTVVKMVQKHSFASFTVLQYHSFLVLKSLTHVWSQIYVDFFRKICVSSALVLGHLEIISKDWAWPYLSTNLTKKDGFYLEAPTKLHGRETCSTSLSLKESDYKIETYMKLSSLTSAFRNTLWCTEMKDFKRVLIIVTA